MRIGIDATCWANKRGYGRFTREIVTAMAALAPENEFICFLDRKAADVFSLSESNVRPIVVDLREAPVVAASAAGRRGLGDILRMTRAVAREPLDVFLSPSVYTYFPLPLNIPAVITIHDAIPERFSKLTFPSARSRLFWRMKVRLALFQARIVLTVSDHAANDLVRVLGVARRKIRVAVEAPATEYRPSTSEGDVTAAAKRAGLPAGARWFVYLGGFNPHKNVPAIVRAHAALAAELGDAAPYLLLIGTRDRDVFQTEGADIQSAIETGGASHLVKWTGFVEDETLRHLHSGSLGLVLVSEAEGFGLPAVEAAACGTAVIATTDSPLPELLEGGGIFIRPGDDASLLSAMRTLATDEKTRRELGANALSAARKLTWDRGARAALAAIREAAR
ncbi:MAG TPA: glycosyltransferase family 1 protein [Gemmatimonadaceae bacterium]|nr:glycosyltransferase family 1 protein [Gemmatimonadaceae bacterium]